MYNFNSILNRATNSKKTLLNNLIYSESEARPFYKLVKKYYESNPNASEEEVYSFFSKFFVYMGSSVLKLPIIKESTYEYNICKFLNKNDRERREIYEKVIKEEKEQGEGIYDEENLPEYSANRLSASRRIMIQSIRELREAQNSFPKEDQQQFRILFQMSKKTQSSVKRDLNDRKYFEQIQELFAGDEFLQVSNFMKKCEPYFQKKLKEEYVESLISIGSKLKELDLLEVYCKKQKQLFTRLNLKELSYDLKNNNSEDIGVEQLFERENLEKLSLKQLSMLNVFWVNRLAKELEAMNKSFFIAKDVGILEKIKNYDDSNDGYIRIQIEESLLKGLYQKMCFLHETINRIFKSFKRNENLYTEQRIEEDGKVYVFKKIDAAPIFSEIKEKMSKEYEEYFSKILPNSKNDIIEDLEDFRIMENASHNAYKNKDKNILAILLNMYENNFSENWGIIQNKNEKNSRMILLAFDVKGINMPVRLHAEKDLVKDFLKAYKGDCLIPIYEGAEDLNYEYSHIRSHILMPLSNPKKEALKKYMEKPVSYIRNLIEHLAFLADGDFPEHLKVETVTKRKGKIKISKKVPPRRYIDLDTNDEYVENGKGEIIKKEIKKEVEGR